MKREEIQQLFADKMLGNPIHIHLEDRSKYRAYAVSDVRDLLRDFKVKDWKAEEGDCDDQADDMRNYLRKNGVKTGYLKRPGHMMLIFCDGRELKALDPGTKRISELEDFEYITWW